MSKRTEPSIYKSDKGNTLAKSTLSRVARATHSEALKRRESGAVVKFSAEQIAAINAANAGAATPEGVIQS